MDIGPKELDSERAVAQSANQKQATVQPVATSLANPAPAEQREPVQEVETESPASTPNSLQNEQPKSTVVQDTESTKDSENNLGLKGHRDNQARW